MNRNHIILGVVGLILLGASGCSYFPWLDIPLGVLTEDFESEWQIGADVPEDPNCPGREVAWAVDISDDRAKGGSYSARFYLDGRQDDGTIWMTRSFGTGTAGMMVEAEIQFDLWSESASDNTIGKVAFYTGAARPQGEADFDTSQAANQTAGWKTYTLVQQTQTGADGRFWVAFGISAVWETEMTYYVDNVSITIRALE